MLVKAAATTEDGTPAAATITFKHLLQIINKIALLIDQKKKPLKQSYLFHK
jgi:hypothetical protein